MFKKIQYGLNINPRHPVGQPADLDTLKGLGWVRLVLRADAELQSLEDAFHFYDPVIAAYRQRGINTLMVLNQETFWGNGPWQAGSDHNWDTYAQGFGAVCGQVATHYRNQGVAYEIWNEGDISEGESSAAVSARDFAKVLQAASAAIKAQDPQATVVFGGLAGAPDAAVAYVQDVRAELKGKLPVDAIGVHPYGKWPPNFSEPPGWGGWFAPLEPHLLKFTSNFPDIPLWITEVGVSEKVAFPPEQYGMVTKYMQGVFTLCQKKFSKQIPVVIWFAWSDGLRNAGLVDLANKPKQAVFDQFFTLVRAEVPQPPKGALVPTGNINIRSGPGTQHPRVDGATPDDWLEPLEDAQTVRAKLGQMGQWIQVRTPGGKVGWAAAWLLRAALDEEGEQSSAPPEPLVAVVPALAPTEATIAPAPPQEMAAITPAPAPESAPSPPAAPVTLLLTPLQGINVRSGPGTTYTPLSSASPGDLLTPLEDEATVRAKLGQPDQWLNVRIPGGQEGWVAAWLVKQVTAADMPKLGHITATSETVPLTPTTANLNVRGGPGQHFAPLDVVSTGSRLSALEPPQTVTDKLKQGKNWVYVRAPNGTEGWAAAWLLRAMTPAEAAGSVPVPQIPISNPADVPTDPALGRARALDFDHTPCFVRLPVCDPEAVDSFSGFGPNNFSYRTWRLSPNTGGLYNNLGGLHSGLDFGIPLRTKLCSVDWGYVVYVGPNKQGVGYGAGPYNVIVRYGRYVALFGHMTDESVAVKKGDIVAPGDLIGLSWTFNQYDHLHFEMRRFHPGYVAELRQKAQAEGAADIPLRMNELFHQWGWAKQSLGLMPDHWINPAPFFNPGLESYWKDFGWKHAANEPSDADNNGYPDRVILAEATVPTVFDLYSLASMPPAAKPHFWAGSRAV